jgi:methylated-DNA-protein-cysteine methyltransferase related protein
VKPKAQSLDPKMMRALARELLRPDQQRDAVILKAVRSIPKGKVAGYGHVAAAAGYPLYHRHVVKLLRTTSATVPWWRVLGSDGSIRLRGDAALEQRQRLEREGVAFKGLKVDMQAHRHRFTPWRD